MFYFLQKHPILQVFIMIALGVFIGIHLFEQPIGYTLYNAGLPFSTPLAEAMSLHSELFRGVVLIIVLLESLLLYSYFKKGKFTENTSFFPIIWLLFFYSFGSFLMPITPIFITNLAVILLINLDSPSHHSKTPVLLSGIVIGFATMYDPLAIAFLIYVAITLIIGKLEWFKDLLVALVGFLIPFIYVGTGFFFKGNIKGFFAAFDHLAIHPYLLTLPQMSHIMLVCLLVFGIFLPYAFIQIKLLSDNKLVVIRNRYIALNILLLVVFFMTLLSSIPLPYSLGYFAVPLSYYLSALVPEKKFSVNKELGLCLFAAAVVVMALGL